MQVLSIGNTAAVVAAHIAESLGNVEEDILKGIVKEVVPECGLIVEATREELKNHPDICGLLYRDVEIVPKET